MALKYKQQRVESDAYVVGPLRSSRGVCECGHPNHGGECHRYGHLWDGWYLCSRCKRHFKSMQQLKERMMSDKP